MAHRSWPSYLSVPIRAFPSFTMIEPAGGRKDKVERHPLVATGVERGSALRQPQAKHLYKRTSELIGMGRNCYYAAHYVQGEDSSCNRHAGQSELHRQHHH